MKEKLCPECQIWGHCSFRKCAEKIAQIVPELEDANKQFEAAAKASRLIAQERIEARGKGCPNLNDVDPDYPGKKLL